jgi:sec-independent protein translocase protein TatB
MFDIGWSELLLVAVLALVFVAPKDLPRMMRTLGQLAAKARSMAREFQQSFEDMARETELEELRKELADLRAKGDEPVMTEKAGPAPKAPLPVDDLSPDMAEAIREAEAIENYVPPAPGQKRGTEP